MNIISNHSAKTQIENFADECCFSAHHVLGKSQLMGKEYRYKFQK
jgi:hypothetical protein